MTGNQHGSSSPTGGTPVTESERVLAESGRLRQEIAETRSELGDTVEALAAKADVKARAQEKVAEVKAEARDRVAALRDTARQRPAPLVVTGAAVATVGVLVLRRRVVRRRAQRS